MRAQRRSSARFVTPAVVSDDSDHDGVAAALRPARSLRVDEPTLPAHGAALANLADGAVLSARAGDHVLIHRLLIAVRQAPSESEFQLTLDHPAYSPADRLIMKRGEQIIAHVRLCTRPIQLGTRRVPAVDFAELVTLPEYAADGCERQLLDAAEQRATEAGALLLTALAEDPAVFLQRDWVYGDHDRCWQVKPRELLAHLATLLQDDPDPLAIPTPEIYVRPWRYIEQAALWRLYDLDSQNRLGALVRDEEYWHWLLMRRGYDRILVAATEPTSDPDGLESSPRSIVGYAFVRRNDVVELVVAPGHERANLRLLQRIASDAIERDEDRLRVFSPPAVGDAHPVERVLAEASGERSLDARHGRALVKVVDASRFLQADLPRLQERVAGSALTGDFRLGLRLGEKRLALEMADRRLRVVQPDRAPGHQLATTAQDASALLLGGLHVPQAVAQGRLRASSPAAQQWAEVLFPRQPFWRPRLDDLPAP